MIRCPSVTQTRGTWTVGMGRGWGRATTGAAPTRAGRSSTIIHPGKATGEYHVFHNIYFNHQHCSRHIYHSESLKNKILFAFGRAKTAQLNLKYEIQADRLIP